MRMAEPAPACTLDVVRKGGFNPVRVGRDSETTRVFAQVIAICSRGGVSDGASAPRSCDAMRHSAQLPASDYVSCRTPLFSRCRL